MDRAPTVKENGSILTSEDSLTKQNKPRSSSGKKAGPGHRTPETEKTLDRRITVQAMNDNKIETKKIISEEGNIKKTEAALN